MCRRHVSKGKRLIESSLREMVKDGFYGCIRRIQFLVVEREFVALAYLLEILANGGSDIPLWFATRSYNFSDLAKAFMRRIFFGSFQMKREHLITFIVVLIANWISLHALYILPVYHV